MRAVAVVVAALAVVAIAGCTQQEAPMPMPAPTASSTPSPGATVDPAPTGLVPGGTAEQNLAFFDATVDALLATNGDPDGRTIIDTLVAAGFDKSAMELTADTTAIGLDADNVQFTVKYPDGCLVGQQGNVGFHSVVLPVLATGRCLVGTTRPIDW